MKHLLLIPILISLLACEKEKVQRQASVFSAPCIINEKSSKYHLVTIIDTTNLSKPNQIYFKWKYESFHIRPANSEYPDVYVNKTDQELLISFCEIADSIPSFDQATFSFINSTPHKFKIRKTY